ncbi:hypothetical protein HYE67_007886 [Fusarium culmorum]|uniref:Zn(2)-C6 fungal-type domain-containing protein n=1 Tax=Fusarium culmorum TaxID=5516 RepID=A0A7S8DC92_FUSCU|nr:hypothetical protein HYE67_007886 [Fusarium culmorum]
MAHHQTQGATYPTKHRRNHPRSKNGCLTCRGRRKKCDETKPNCNFCVKSAHTCVWPTEDNNQKQESQNGSPSSTNSERSPLEQQCQALMVDKSGVTNLALSTSSNLKVFERFIFDWGTHGDIPSGSTMAWFGNLPYIYANSGVDSLLHKSVNALANASYAQRFNSSEALRNAIKWYGESIHMLKESMLCVVDSSSYCDIISSIMCLGFYEANKSIGFEGAWGSHISGASVLLKMRGQKKTVNPKLEYEVSIVSYMQMISGNLLTGTAPHVTSASMNELCLSKLPQLYSHTELIYQSACLCTEWKKALLISETDEGLETLCIIFNKALILDEQLENWTHNLPAWANYTVQSVSIDSQPEWLLPLLNGPWNPPNTHIYPSLMVQTLWRFYWMARLIISQALLFTSTIIERAATKPLNFSRLDVESRLITFINHLCESCLAAFMPVTRNDPQSSKVEDVPILLAYLILQVFPTIGLCLEQISINDLDIVGRRDWVAKMRHFLRVNFGIAKGATAIPLTEVGSIPIQMWGL